MSLTGRILEDRYELRELLGQGASGQVYLAHDRRLQRPLAVKVLRAQLAEDEAHFRRFEREATTVARLNHPNVVAVYDFGMEELSFIAMELVPGRSLAQVLAEEGPLQPTPVLDIAEPVLAALAHAHKQGVVHRDVKPGNILLGESGEVKLTDFGIASLAGRQRITETGMVLGTASYLSPEQAQGLPATAASDLYAVGAVLFEMLAGHPPFEADTTVAVALKHVHEPPPSLSAERPDLPAAFEQVVGRALAKDPARRFPDAESFAEALRVVRMGVQDADATTVGAAGAAMAGAAGAGAFRGNAGPTGATTNIRGEVLEPTEVRSTTPATAAGDGAGRRPPSRRVGNAALAVLFVLLLVGAGSMALALSRGDADNEAGDTGQGSSTTADATAPSEAAPSTSTPATTSPPATAPAETAPATTAAPSRVPGRDEDDDGDDDRDDDDDGNDQSNPEQARPTEVTSFGAKVRLPPGWQPREVTTSETLRTFIASGPAGATLRVDEDRTWGGGWEDLLLDVQSLEADLQAKYADMRTLSLERTEYRGARAVRWEFVYTGGSGTLHKIDLFFQKDQKTPPAAILVSWPEGSRQGESEARTVLESLEF